MGMTSTEGEFFDVLMGLTRKGLGGAIGGGSSSFRGFTSAISLAQLSS